MVDLAGGTPIKDVSIEKLQQLAPQIAGWVYPQMELAKYIERFSKHQRAALKLWSGAASVLFLAGFGLAWYYHNWWWLLLVLAAVVLWKSNQKTLGEFFVANLQSDAMFYNSMRVGRMGDAVKIVFKTP